MHSYAVCFFSNKEASSVEETECDIFFFKELFGDYSFDNCSN